MNLRTGQWALFGRVSTTPTPPAPAGMALIPAGNFSMGDSFSEGGSDERPVHTVYVSAFHMDKYEVTKALWDEVRAWGLNNGYTDLPVGSGKASNHPVHSINWYDVVKWCNARSQKEGRPVCYTVGGNVYKTGTSTPDCNWSAAGYRLPTEAEWEKAARGGANGRRYPWSDSDTIQHKRANYFSSSSDSYDTSTTQGKHPDSGSWPPTMAVGSFTANGYGLYDMAGNVSEFCWDWRSNGYDGSSPVADPHGAAFGLGPHGAAYGSGRVHRGGSWNDYASGCRVAYRGDDSPYPGGASFGIGFRAVLPEQ